VLDAARVSNHQLPVGERMFSSALFFKSLNPSIHETNKNIGVFIAENIQFAVFPFGAVMEGHNVDFMGKKNL